MASTPIRTAIISGACSGIGLALVEHLLESTLVSWRVVLVDINKEAGEKIVTDLSSKHGPDRVLYIYCDVALFESNAAAFKKTFEWSNNRIDFFAANAGTIGHLKQLLALDLDADLTPPDLNTLNVNLVSMFYGLRCFLYYTRKTRQLHAQSQSDPETGDLNSAFNPKMVITSSDTGLYHFPVDPIYSSTKAATINFVRSISNLLAQTEGIHLNAICPGLVVTKLLPDIHRESAPEERITHMSTLMNAYDELIAGVAGNEEKDSNAPTGKFGQCVESSADKLYYRQAVDFADETAKWLIEDPEGYWLGELYKKKLMKLRGDV